MSLAAKGYIVGDIPFWLSLDSLRFWSLASDVYIFHRHMCLKCLPLQLSALGNVPGFHLGTEVRKDYGPRQAECFTGCFWPGNTSAGSGSVPRRVGRVVSVILWCKHWLAAIAVNINSMTYYDYTYIAITARAGCLFCFLCSYCIYTGIYIYIYVCTHIYIESPSDMTHRPLLECANCHIYLQFLESICMR